MSKALVDFSTQKKKSHYCVCDGCHDVTNVTKIRYPISKYRDGKTLVTWYEGVLYCDDCIAKLLHAITNPDVEDMI